MLASVSAIPVYSPIIKNAMNSSSFDMCDEKVRIR